MTTAQGRPDPYNPLDDENLARNVADALEAEPVHPFPPAPARWTHNPIPSTAGLYALYYVGSAEPYESLGDLTRRDTDADDAGVGPHAIPIYVGRALATATRQGQASNKGPKGLRLRLGEHRGSIKQASATLDLDDFRFRYLIVKDIWVPLGEYGLLRRYTPLWNNVLDGFGIHGPGGGRGEQARSLWDTLHPGRSFAASLPDNNLSIGRIKVLVRQALDAMVHDQPVPSELLIAEPPEEPELTE
ncbi:Eco29kI family restriction endonuclease [Spirillospora sp. CA-294931]|uniref:Eco29kI family restriction endonuclease n=1 Tax=Spirillospora sp. CA-294931 TaxID=3240042 RepID=UPI003D8B0F88